ncbi:NAD(P)-binding protein [Lepidopterella palustris CBS 459.81]|uniref:NAD(P)-binding protein n=1 Tax=Lepidopterella palustris CBS 459.81 TaxID=1314670 RepID=A0A8E2JJC5_9PEZI|nr:NAD(P)-binding protein [Lepidopterella palustris CBS 459.81]
MEDFTISDDNLDDLKNKVVIITGGSSGIGLATVKLFVESGAKVVVGDVNPPPEPEKPKVTYFPVDVTSWDDQAAMFKKAEELHGSIDHVFANAGISPKGSFMDDQLDENGELLAPNLRVMDVNLTGCMYTTKLGIYYLKKNDKGGSIVLTASASSFQRFSVIDYTTSKHAVLGLMRSLVGNLHPNLPIRINAISPSWTNTGIMPPYFFTLLGNKVQSPDIVARSVVVLMADKSRHGQLIYSAEGKFKEMDGSMLSHVKKMLGSESSEPEEGVMQKILAYGEAMKAKQTL